MAVTNTSQSQVHLRIRAPCLDSPVEQRRRLILLPILLPEGAKGEEHLSISNMGPFDLLELVRQRRGRFVGPPSTPPSLSHCPDVIQGPVPVSKIAPYNSIDQFTVLSRESASGPLPREYDLVQQRQTVVSVQDERLACETELVPKRVDLLFEHPVFVVQIRHVGHNEVKVNLLPARLGRFCAYVLDDLSQAPQILLVGKNSIATASGSWRVQMPPVSV